MVVAAAKQCQGSLASHDKEEVHHPISRMEGVLEAEGTLPFREVGLLVEHIVRSSRFLRTVDDTLAVAQEEEDSRCCHQS